MTFKDFKLNSIRTKLITSLIAICVIPLTIGGFGSYMQSKSILTNKLTLTSTQTLSEIDSGLTNYFNGFSDIINLTANNPGIINIDTDNNTPMISDMLKGIKESDNDIFDVYYGTASKKFTIYPISTMPEGYDPTTRPWYKQALANKGKVVITPPYKDIVTGKTLVGVVQTVEKNGQVVGVIGLDCSLTTLTERISTKKVGTTGYVFVSDSSGTTLAHPQKELINTNLISKLSFWDKAKSGNSGFVNYTYNGTSKFGVYQTNKLTGWKLVAALDKSELTRDTNSILVKTFLIIIVMGIIAIFLSLFLSKGISNNIKKLKGVFSKASNGDLTVSITASTKDEFKDLAESFNLMMKNISKLMNNVLKSSETVLETSTSLASMSEEVTASVGEVAKSVEEVSLGATEQAKGAQNGASEMEDLSNRLKEVSISSDEMDKISNATKRLGTKGLSVVDTLTEKSNKAKTVTTSVNDIVRDMNESAKQINSISETISEITEQTNLLALNASIESARAGEAGKGFAVVAEEIRILAEESQNSTNEIKKIIESIQNKSETAVSAIKSAESAVDEQYLAVDQTHKIFKVILKSIESMIAKVDEVKTSISDINEKKQSTISEIDNISSISQETAAASQETTASTEEISATMEELTKHSSNLQILAEQLAAEINKFKIN
ncbi:MULTISPECIES: methyl-accepting chemotaxis protein [Clostridium]|uniref:Methyl-accepting chemotaxis protein n=3 Tax=Clostridium TaxID=1485 RepID=D8GS61_CLOLD|nr:MULTISPECIES: methyl-accepting chemotaxis protein [Clostridium]ADK14414.1 methyl-accepting chemotaxis protein [Clostridium ljungdahlii DSM 13528]AGY77633.1 methyl-accepting chemotaxis protein [Clostridium autoethanogenum DSM 10061]ALU37772.1 Methyl-accepting chemotaxis protein [Clostridium autoethanogenum DSM 10061]OAA88165.1 Methyl-accepting chemotaxis protein McpC [Clostridium ljungdahlii DSM 13528]OVY49877.1 Methyl-accepting chemotaxis protein McpC [Clostridium autoethanogenum]